MTGKCSPMPGSVSRGLPAAFDSLSGRFSQPLPHCNGVAASLALHHIPAIDTKRALYRRIHDALGPAGVFVNADATMPAEPVAREATWRAWADYMVAQGVEERRVFEHFKEWAEEDTYFPLEEELAAVESAGLRCRVRLA